MNSGYSVLGCTLLFLLCGGQYLCSQPVNYEHWVEEYYGTDEGLPNRTVRGAARDNNQLLWVGTEGGLSLLDGYKVKVFKEFPQRFNGDLKRDDQGFLIATLTTHPDSIEFFNPATFQATGERLGSPGLGYFGGISHREGAPLYFACGNGVFAFVPGGEARIVHTLSNELMPGDQLVYADKESFLIYSGKRLELSGLIDGEVYRQVLPFAPVKIFREKGGGVLISGEEGIFRQLPDGEAFTFLQALPSGKVINFIFEDDNQNFLVGNLDRYHLTVSDLHLMREGRLTPASGIIDRENRIISIAGSDFRTSMRLQTHGGLYFLKPDDSELIFHRYLYRDLPPGKFGDVMRGFAADDAGNVYVNKDSKMPYWFRVDAVTQELDTLTMRTNDGKVADQYGCGTNLINHRGDIFGHSCDVDTMKNFVGHVYRYRPTDGSWKRWPLPEKNQVIRWVDQGRTDDELLLVTEHKVTHKDGHLYYFYPEEDCLVEIETSGPVYNIWGYTKGAVRDTARNCMWLGTDQAFYRFNFDDERLFSYTFPDGGNTTVSDIMLMGDDLLLATFTRGLQNFHVPTGTFTTVGGVLPQGKRPPDNKYFLELPSNDVATLRSTKDHGLLIATFRGLVYHGGDHQSSSIFTTDQGLTDNEFNTPSLFYADSLKRWFAGTINGFVSFSTDNMKERRSPYEPAITALRTVDEGEEYESIRQLPSDSIERIILEPSTLYFSFDFNIPDYTGGGDRRYQTLLEGFDLNWTASTISPSVRYARLLPGDYVFNLRAFDTAGRLSPTVRQVHITVLKPWYQHYWFFCISALLLVLGMYLFICVRLARVREKLEVERKLQDLELRSLRQQINPHFISNAMNAIREYVRRKDTENPTKYLTDFSLMMRQFLESSRHRFTTVKKEVDMLERYVGLEQLRFPGKFTTYFYVDPAIDPDMDEVPSLLLQPLVENAIEHGLRPLKGGGELRVSIELDPFDDDVLICTVSDNGVGRRISANSARHPGHVSRATQILEDRRTVLERDARVKLSVTTEDLNDQIEYTGTVVTVRIEGS